MNKRNKTNKGNKKTKEITIIEGNRKSSGNENLSGNKTTQGNLKTEEITIIEVGEKAEGNKKSSGNEKSSGNYHTLFDTGNKGYLTKEELEIYKIFRRDYKFNKEDILDMEITEENINKLVSKFNLKFSKKDVQTMVEYINQQDN